MTGEKHKPEFPIAYREIKHPYAYLEKNDGNTRSVWWRSGDCVVCFDDIPGNYPRWTIGCLTLKEAKRRIVEMQREGWELIESNMEL